ncbi:prenyltransferase/squalene oxidase repeat-containing protein [Streptomyces sp. NPDC005202]|uniref:prenyltransferase/squalene oxidase repeat-containing protein n=1 Tax=Streptomyces sp. NPDC005202 TaxID=3157021 RepID=UPI0033A08020
MSQQQLGRGPLRTGGPVPVPTGPGDGGSPRARFVGWLGGLGGAAAGYGVFQFLFEVLPDSLSGQLAKYLIAGVSGLGTAAAAWLAAGLVRARSDRPARTTAAFTAAARPAPGPLPQVLAAAYDTLVDQVAVVDDPVRGRLTGWSHSLGESTPSRPTSVGTAYGLHIMLDLGVSDGRLSTGDLVDTLWRLRLPDGGWSARSQGSEPRPEVTALVLGALARAGASRERLAEEVARCEARFTRELDAVGRESTHVVTTVLRGLLRAAPRSDVLPRLREALVDGALDDGRRDHLRSWSYRLDAPYGPPSPLHTAQAVVALDRAARVLGENAGARAAREDGVRWLLACPDAPHDACLDLENLREEVRRPRTDDPSRHEVLNVRHFTAAWVVRALLSPGAQDVARADGLEAEWRERLDGAVAAVWAGQAGGIWTWGRGDSTGLRQPMWMTYQGISALRAHAVWMYQPDH